MPAIGEIIIILMIFALMGGSALAIWTTIDAALRTDEAFRAIGHHKLVWAVLPVALMVVGVGWILALVYLLAIRPKLA